MLHKKLNKMKGIVGIEKFDITKILIDTDEKMSDNITLKVVVILRTCVIKDYNDFFPQLLLEGQLFYK